MPDPKNNKKELPKKVDTRYTDNLKMVLEKHRRQNNQPTPPPTSNKSYSKKDKIAQEQYGEFGFDTLKYEEQERVYKNNPGLQRGEGDKYTDFKGPLDMLKPKSPFQFKGANSSNSKCWPGYKKVGTKPSPSGTGETVNDCKKK